jgi:hypothetical protein
MQLPCQTGQGEKKHSHFCLITIASATRYISGATLLFQAKPLEFPVQGALADTQRLRDLATVVVVLL